MHEAHQRRTWWRAVAGLCVFASSCGLAQNNNGDLALSKTQTNLLLSWTGVGSILSGAALNGAWSEVLEATNPLPLAATNDQQFFRLISRYSQRASLPEANSELAIAELGGEIYLIGGYPASRVTVATVQVYNSAQNNWRLTTPLPTPLNHAMAAAVNGKIYLIGGQTDSGSTSFVDTVYAYDPVTTNWTSRAHMPTARSAGAAAVIGDLIYVAGGRPPQGQDFAVYDTQSNTWQTLPNMPTGRNHLAACAIGGKVYVAGGRLGAGFTSAMTNVLEVFDPAINSWTTLAPMPVAHGGINGITANGNFFVWGGEGPSGVFTNMEMYVPALDRWYELEPLPVAVHGVTGSAFINGWIYMPGGGTSQGGSSGSTIHQVFWVEGIGAAKLVP